MNHIVPTTINKKSTMKPSNDYGQFYIIDENTPEYTQQVTIERDPIPILKNDLYFNNSPIIKVCIAILYVCNYIYESITV